MDQNWGAVLIGFAGGALSTAAISAFLKQCIFHPVISVSLDREKGCYGSVKLYEVNNQGQVTGSHPGKFFRLHIENTGLSSIKDCSGYITKITKRTDKGQAFPHREIIELGWVNATVRGARDIPRGAFFHMDIVTLNLWPDGRRELSLPYPSPTTLEGFFADKATYGFEVLVAADNARPCHQIPIVFDFDPQSNDLQFAPVDRTRSPWWARLYRRQAS
jgi:hypothetical protein